MWNAPAWPCAGDSNADSWFVNRQNRTCMHEAFIRITDDKQLNKSQYTKIRIPRHLIVLRPTKSLHLADRGQNTSGSLTSSRAYRKLQSYDLNPADQFQRSKSQAGSQLIDINKGSMIGDSVAMASVSVIHPSKLPIGSIHLRQVLEAAKSTGDPVLFKCLVPDHIILSW